MMVNGQQIGRDGARHAHALQPSHTWLQQKLKKYRQHDWQHDRAR
jgi:hypothetical protein